MVDPKKEEGDIVLMVKDDVSRGQWPLAVEDETVLDSDCHVRQTSVLQTRAVSAVMSGSCVSWRNRSEWKKIAPDIVTV